MRLLVLLAALVLGAGLALPARAADSTTTDLGTLDKDAVARAVKMPGCSPYAGRKFPTRPFFGDTHLHTALSLDARAFGNTLGPEEAYRFARGEEGMSATGQPAKVSRPLDFLVVAGHSEALGAMVEVARGNPAVMNDPDCKRWHDMMKEGQTRSSASSSRSSPPRHMGSGSGSRSAAASSPRTAVGHGPRTATTEERPDCLVLDVHMPGLTGFEVLARLQSDGVRLPAVVITGFDELDAERRAVRLGAAKFLRQPVREDELLAAVDQAASATP